MKQEDVPEEILVVAETLRVDAVSAEVISLLEREGFASILLKGPSIARWLYPRGIRGYVDSDILVEEDSLPAVREKLRAQRFQTAGGNLAADRPPHSEDWHRPEDGALIDLHRTLGGVTAPPQTVWKILWSHRERMTIVDTPITILAPEARILHISLHARFSVPFESRPLEDLRRATEQADLSTWEAAASLAAELGEIRSFSRGLCRLPSGSQIARVLDLPILQGNDPIEELALRRPHAANFVLALDWLEGRSAKDRARYVATKLFPPITYLRRTSGLARRGWAGVAAAYAIRPFRLLPNAILGIMMFAKTKRPGRR